MKIESSKNFNYPFLLIPDHLTKKLEKEIPLPFEQPIEPNMPYKNDSL